MTLLPGLLTVEGLRVQAGPAAAGQFAVDGVSFAIRQGESFGLVGESGCGKTTTAKALLGLLPPGLTIAAGSIGFRGTELVGLPRPAMNRLRWRDIALVTQSAMNALDPVMRVGAQITEAMRAHEPVTKAAARARMLALLDQVSLAPAWADRYPHEFSGGMRQRAIIAMALACDPALIVADEPTTALDVIIQDEVFALLERVREGGRRALLLISHDLSLVAENCDRVAVMYAGQIVETGPAEALFARPAHPYTIGLQSAFPDLDSTHGELISMPGSPPGTGPHAPGCRFAPRCPFVRARCRTEAPALLPVPGLGPGSDSPASADHAVACHFVAEAAGFRRLGARAETWEAIEAAA